MGTSAGQPGAVCAARIDKRHLPSLPLYWDHCLKIASTRTSCGGNGKCTSAFSAPGKDAELTRGILFIYTSQVHTQRGTILQAVSRHALPESELNASFIVAGHVYTTESRHRLISTAERECYCARFNVKQV